MSTRARLALIVIVGCVLLGTMAARSIWQSRRELQQAERLAKIGRTDSAIIHYRRAARWYVPGSPFVTDALQQLEGLAGRYERAGDTAGALAAYRSIRAAIMASRSLYTPHADRLKAADRHIARLMALNPTTPADARKSPEQRQSEYYALLRNVKRPNVFWTFVLLLGFATWTVGALLFFQNSFDESNRLKRTPALRWSLVVGLGLALFVAGATFA